MWFEWADRFLSKILVADSGCWLWAGDRRPNGYGRFSVSGHGRAAHRLAYEMFIGVIPDGLTIDHLCQVKHCVNPTHLEVVTSRENTLRCVYSPASLNASKMQCIRGHDLIGDNVRWYRNERVCRACVREHWRRQAGKSEFRSYQRRKPYKSVI